LATWARALRPGAPCVFSTLGPDSLKELRQALSASGQPDTVHPFYDMHDVGDALIRAGFSSPVLDVERLTITYASFDEMLVELRILGGFSALRSRPRGLRTPASLAALARNYAQIGAADGVLRVTLEVVYAHGWRRAGADRPQDGSTVASFPLDQLRTRR
ncbi:MAG: malonyl-[acyl-carrier protein] O-methyltransferase BioC, partial [Gammaproteobacteria bacterium]|nr:malonyl-[acyl-carrier protein] O-methyltransferase BioC [Gammaproteobacteria bacterium]